MWLSVGFGAIGPVFDSGARQHANDAGDPTRNGIPLFGERRVLGQYPLSRRQKLYCPRRPPLALGFYVARYHNGLWRRRGRLITQPTSTVDLEARQCSRTPRRQVIGTRSFWFPLTIVMLDLLRLWAVSPVACYALHDDSGRGTKSKPTCSTVRSIMFEPPNQNTLCSKPRINRQRNSASIGYTAA